MTGVQPIYMMVAQAQSGAELGDAILQAPIETLNDDRLYDFMEGSGVVYQALASADPARAVEYFGVQKALNLLGADPSRQQVAVLALKNRLAAVLGGLNGTWPQFRAAFDSRAQRMRLFSTPAQMRAQAAQMLCGSILRRSGIQETGNSVSGEIQARPVSTNRHPPAKHPEKAEPCEDDSHFDRLLMELVRAIRTS